LEQLQQINNQKHQLHHLEQHQHQPQEAQDYSDLLHLHQEELKAYLEEQLLVEQVYLLLVQLISQVNQQVHKDLDLGN